MDIAKATAALVSTSGAGAGWVLTITGALRTMRGGTRFETFFAEAAFLRGFFAAFFAGAAFPTGFFAGAAFFAGFLAVFLDETDFFAGAAFLTAFLAGFFDDTFTAMWHLLFFRSAVRAEASSTRGRLRKARESP